MQPPARYRLLCSILIPLVKTKILSVENAHSLPRHQPLIFASNHTSWLDPLYLIAAIQTFSGRAVMFLASTKRHAWTKGAIPVDPANRAVVLDRALEELRRGSHITIFPFGNPSEARTKPMTGIARLARASGAPVVPVSLTGVLPANPRRVLASFFRQRRVVRIRFGNPLSLPHEPPKDSATLRADLDRIISALRNVTPTPCTASSEQA